MLWLFFWASSWKLFSARSFDIVEEGLLEKVLILDVSVGSSIGEVGFAASTNKISTL